MAKLNLDSGFLILYDWLPAFESLGGEELKNLLFSLIAYQKSQTPIPTFDDPMSNVFAKMIEPTIKRRLDGQAAMAKHSRSTADVSDNDTLSPDVEDTVEATPEGRVEGRVEATHEGRVEGRVEATPEGRVEGRVEATPEGRVEATLYPSREEIRKEERSVAIYSKDKESIPTSRVPVRAKDSDILSESQKEIPFKSPEDIDEFCKKLLANTEAAPQRRKNRR